MARCMSTCSIFLSHCLFLCSGHINVSESVTVRAVSRCTPLLLHRRRFVCQRRRSVTLSILATSGHVLRLFRSKRPSLSRTQGALKGNDYDKQHHSYSPGSRDAAAATGGDRQDEGGLCR